MSETKRLRNLEVENAKLKRLLADAMRDVSTLKEMLEKTSNAQDPERSGGLGDEGKGGHPQLWACGLVGMDPRVYRYRSTRPDDGTLRQRLRELAAEGRRFGYRGLHLLLLREGRVLNRKKLCRLYKEEKLTVRKRGGRKRALGTRAPMTIPQGANQRWSVDFASDPERQPPLPRLLCDRRLHTGVRGHRRQQLHHRRARCQRAG